ncbi:MAG: hypothetical protein ACYTGC_18295 [Planctomycetota bacterium]|jgi:hypothetical protein
MKNETIVWTVVFVVAGIILILRAAVFVPGMGTAYVRPIERQFAPVQKTAEDGTLVDGWVEVGSSEAAQYTDQLAGVTPDQMVGWTTVESATRGDYLRAEAADPTQTAVRLSIRRSIGVWLAAFFTIAIFSFVYRDNPFYKVSESIFIGVSAAYWMVVGFWTVIIPNVVGKVWPVWIKSWALPGLDGEDLHPDYVYVIPMILGVMLLWRLAPVGGWISRWPLAFIIGIFCGLRLMSFIHADFLSQIRNTIMPLTVMENGAFDIWGSLRSFFIIGGVLACLVYFFFSFEHRGFVGRTAKVGIWVLMITFGAGFGYTVMGRIALLAIRLEFLFDDWLWLIDPTNKRVVTTAVGMLL